MKNMKIRDIALLFTGVSFRGSESKLPEGGTPLVSYRNLTRDGGIDWGNVARVKLPSKHSVDPLKDHDILFTSRGTRSYAYQVIAPPPGSTCSPQLLVIKPDLDRVDPTFLTWFINQPTTQQHFDRYAGGTVIRNITKSTLGDVLVPAIPLARQKSISAYTEAARLSRLAQKASIENLYKQDAALAAQLATGALK